MKNLICRLTGHLRLWSETAFSRVGWPRDFSPASGYWSLSADVHDLEANEIHGEACSKVEVFKVCGCGKRSKRVFLDYEA